MENANSGSPATGKATQRRPFLEGLLTRGIAGTFIAGGGGEADRTTPWRGSPVFAAPGRWNTIRGDVATSRELTAWM
jgi:hypothetical protein